jgi:hypothetical protein
VYAISGKASDVRGVVTKLNEKRQQADEARDQALIIGLDLEYYDLPYHEERHDPAGPAVAWQDYLDQARACLHDLQHLMPPACLLFSSWKSVRSFYT